MVLLLVACATPAPSSPAEASWTDTSPGTAPHDDTDTDTDDTDPGTDTAGDCVDTGVTDTAAVTCEAVTPGDWQWEGACPRMTTPCTLAVDGCAVVLSYEGMTMGMPHEATVYGDRVVFDDLGTVTGCRGTLLDPDTIVGCCDGGCGFRLVR